MFGNAANCAADSIPKRVKRLNGYTLLFLFSSPLLIQAEIDFPEVNMTANNLIQRKVRKVTDMFSSLKGSHFFNNLVKEVNPA